MKIPRIAEAIGNIPEELVSDAVTYKRVSKKKAFVRWGSLAACFAVMVVAVALIIPMLSGGAPISIGGIDRNYMGTISGSEGNIEFLWAYKLPYEKFMTVTFDKNEYFARGRVIGEALLGEMLGTCEAKGVDSYTNKIHTETFNVRKIKGVLEDKLIALEMDGEYYVYFNHKEKSPETFGELLDAYQLSEALPLIKFSVNEGYKEKGYYQIADDAYIWQVLSECRNAEVYAENDKWDRGDRNYLSFTATSEKLGVYKRVLYITEDGYVSTNVFDYSYVYFIGEDAANKIIAYTKSSATEAEREQYEYTLAGTVTEIGDGYMLIDDTVLCKDKDDGMVFKVLTDELIIRRYLECFDIKVGDTVAVKFQTEIVLGEDNTVEGAISMYRGTVTDNGMEIPE